MKKSATHWSIYTQAQSGVLVQTGRSSDFNMRDSYSYLTVKQRGLDLQDLYRKNGVVIHPQSYLAKLIDDTSVLSDAWLRNDQSLIENSKLFSASQLDRVATAALPLGVSEKAKKYLSELLIGSLDLLNRDRSKAKDTLWELELWQSFTRMGMHSVLEEPDIVVSFGDARIGISCKKFYSENNVSKVLSKAVSQFKSNFDFGIIAINLDDLTPEKSILKAASIDQMLDKLSQINLEFIKKHERYFRKYLEPGRAIAAIVSTSVIADVANVSTNFNNSRQTTLWNIPGLSLDKETQIRNFFNAANAAHS